MQRFKGFLAIVLASMILGSFGVLIRQLAVTFSDAGQVFVRSVFATLIILVLIFSKKIHLFRIRGNNFWYILFFSIVFPASLLCFTVSANMIKVSNSLFMLYVGSLTSTVLLGRLLFGEKIDLRRILALTLVFIGLMFFVYPVDLLSLSSGLVLGLLAGIFEGVSHSLRRLMKDLQREVIVFYQSVSGAIVAFGLLVFSQEAFIRDFQISSILIAIIFGGLLVAIGYLLAFGFANFDVNLGSIVLVTELFFAVVINSLILKEFPTYGEITGGVFIVLGTILAALNLQKKPDKE